MANMVNGTDVTISGVADYRNTLTRLSRCGASAWMLLAAREYMDGRADVSTIVAVSAASPAARPRPWRRLIPIAGMGLWMAACGAGTSTPTGPSANVPSANVPPPNVPTPHVGFQITPQPDVLLAGSSVALTATDASTGAVVEPSWSSSDSTVAVVSLGQLRALHAGVATIGASMDGATNTFVVKVVPDYAGTYDGTMFIAECINGAVSIYCRGFSRTGRFVARLTQAKDAVSGTLSVFGSAPGPIEGRIDTAGRLTVTGRLGDPARIFIDLESWSTFLSGTQMYGTFTMREMDGAVYRGSKRADLPGIGRIP